jgi:hypothetical protein
VTPLALLEALVELATEAGIRVRAARPDEPPLASGLCKVKGEIWLVLLPSDPVEHQIDLVCGALRAHAAELLETRWLPPELRSRIEGGDLGTVRN